MDYDVRVTVILPLMCGLVSAQIPVCIDINAIGPGIGSISYTHLINVPRPGPS